MSWIIAAAAGAVFGVLSGYGVGGGTLLMIFMTAIAGIDQNMAQGINLLYFIPTSSVALYFHIKNKMIEKDAAISAIISGVIFSVISAMVANAIDVSLLKKGFGCFLIILGVREVLKK